MTVEETVLENVKKLSAERKQEVLDFAEFLLQKDSPKKPRRSLKGALAHLSIQITDEDIRESRREMWSGYMKEDFE
jgi:hypothetical protein